MRVHPLEQDRHAMKIRKRPANRLLLVFLFLAVAVLLATRLNVPADPNVPLQIIDDQAAPPQPPPPAPVSVPENDLEPDLKRQQSSHDSSLAQDTDDDDSDDDQDQMSTDEVEPEILRSGPPTKTIMYYSDGFDSLPHDEYRAFKLASFEQGKSFNGGNIGNYVWKYGAYNQLPVFHKELSCKHNRKACMDYAKVQNATMAEYRPVANYFRDDNMQSGLEYNYFRVSTRQGIPTMFIGVGMDMPFETNGRVGSFVMDSSRSIETSVEDFTLSEAGQLALAEFEKLKFPIFVRGDMTRDVLTRNGYTHSISNGCPSLMISHNVRLGETLEQKYKALKDRIGDSTLKVALNFKSSPAYYTMAKTILRKYPDSYIYSQGLADFNSLSKNGFPLERVRFLPNFFDWQDSLREMDVSFGGRIHGSMIALSVEVPSFVIAPDHRVLELVERMKIPHNTVYSEDLDAENIDVAEVMTKKEFDGKEFDQNRCGIAKNYREVFGRYGVGVKDHVKAISELC